MIHPQKIKRMEMIFFTLRIVYQLQGDTLHEHIFSDIMMSGYESSEDT